MVICYETPFKDTTRSKIDRDDVGDHPSGLPQRLRQIIWRSALGVVYLSATCIAAHQYS